MESGNDYVIQVKRNQAKLLCTIEKIMMNTAPIDISKSLDKRHGRFENRHVSLYHIDSKDQDLSQWTGLQSIIHVYSFGTRNLKPYLCNRYYISSSQHRSASYFAKGIRAHWGIENKLHWVKDVILNEDNSGIKSGKIARNLSLIKSGVISLFRINGFNSIKYTIESFTNRPREAMVLIHQTHI